ncbi:hypothetical protein FRB96_000149 [Tulasnella sp. 330]|nr:hypothetical protein FRB96_000149 [Tulasnella sp. 330]
MESQSLAPPNPLSPGLGLYRCVILLSYLAQLTSSSHPFQYCLIFLPGFASGQLSDRGYIRLPAFMTSVVASTFLVAECKTLWQLIPCQGFAIGVSAGFIFLPSLNVIPYWFDKRRGRAYGISAVGSSLGGTILPIIIRHLMTAVGYKWTVRIMAFIPLALMAVFNLTARTRVLIAKVDRAPVPVKELLTHKIFMTYVLGTSVVSFGLHNCLIFLYVSTQHFGIPASTSFYTIVAANAASGVGRLSSGFLGERYGVLNALIIFTT